MSQGKALYLAEDMDAPEVTTRLGGTLVIYSAKCPGKLSDNEDVAAVIETDDHRGVLVVNDGMGGGAAGEQASRIAAQAIQREVKDKSDEEFGLRAAILNGIESANQQILELGIGAATTLAAVEIQGDTIRPYHVGDSSILVVGQRGKVKLQTVAHSPASLAVEAGVIDDHEAMSHESRHLVTNILGTADMRIEIGSTIQLSKFDTVLLATDGLFDNLSVDEIVSRIRKGPLVDGVKGICQEVENRMAGTSAHPVCKPDDLTLIAFRLSV